MTKKISLCSILAATVALYAGPAMADGYTEWQEVFLKIAASEEAAEEDQLGEEQFTTLAAAAASGGVTELPARWSKRLKLRSQARRASHDRLLELQGKIDGLSDSVKSANAKSVAHAQVDIWHALHELSETHRHVNTANEYLDHAARDLSDLKAADRDGDGIFDDRDRCPDSPEDKDGWQDSDGCPDPDNDGDGINDADDRCPNQAESKNGFRDADGCPDNAPEPVYFKSDSSALDAEARATLARNATLIKSMRGLVLQVVGHADSRNGDAYNEKLGMRRAMAVRSYLVNELGVNANRLGVSSEGESYPYGDNATREGRAENRRVDFTAVE